MARKARIEFDGAVYHVMDRGDRQEAIFLDDEDHLIFLKTLWQACERTGWRVHSYVLMGNHYHLLLETPVGNLSAGMRWLQATYTIRHNVRHQLCGHLFQGRFKAIVMDPDDAGRFRTVSDYIHLNPARAGIVLPSQILGEYRWSSFPALCGSPKHRPAGLEAARIVCGYGDSDTASGRRRYRQFMEDRARRLRDDPLDDEMLKDLRRGWCFASEQFRQELLENFDSLTGHPSPSEKKIRRHDENEAECLVRRGLDLLGLGELDEIPKGDPAKIALAVFVKERTIVTNLWIARRLEMGDPSRVSRYCSEGPSREDVKRFVSRLKKAGSKN